MLDTKIAEYFQSQGVSEEVIKKAIAALKNTAHSSEKIDSDIFKHHR